MRTPAAAAAPPPPAAYAAPLQLLRAAAADSRWPDTSAARARLLIEGCSITVSNPSTLGKRRPPLANRLFPRLVAELFELERRIAPSARTYPATARAPQRRPPSTLCAINVDARFAPHLDLGCGAPGALSLVVSLGAHTGGAVAVRGGTELQVRHRPVQFDGWELLHWTQPWAGDERFSLAFFTPASSSREAAAAAIIAALRPPFRCRPRSTDAHAVIEVLGARPCYAGPPLGDPRWPDVDWSLRGHTVLDGGAHIGAFTRFALARGAARVDAYEPEPANAALFRENAAAALAAGRVALHEAALVLDPARPAAEHATPPPGGGDGDGDGGDGGDGGGGCGGGGDGNAAAAAREGVASLVLGRARTDGVENTWRHALDGLSHYRDGADGAPLRRVTVATRPLFGPAGALRADTSFVKLDVEGAEVALLSGFRPGAWRGVRRLVFEYSFTKERRMDRFRAVVRRLEAEGFAVMYEGRGSWDRLEAWPWPTDAVVYAAR